jgi:DNA-directed RNA polymerase subunit RPC12/RpoP
MDIQKIAESIVAENTKTFECPECGTKVLENTGYCVKCKKKVKKAENTKTFECPECGTKVLENTGYCIKCKKKVKKAGSGQVADMILSQMGGMNRIRAMTGAHGFATNGNDVGFLFPNRQRSKGNMVRISYNRGMDLYDMEFFNVSISGIKSVKKYNGVYNDSLADIFTRQTGLRLSL